MNMKKSFAFFTALGAFLAVSCNEDIKIESNQPVMKIVTLNASIDDESTKTSYSAGEGSTLLFSWTIGDEISVLCSDDAFHTFTATSVNGKQATFTATLEGGVNVGDKAYFPADASHTSSYYNLPYYKDITSHPSADIPMFGTKDGSGNFNFAHCAGAATITINNLPANVTSATIQVKSNNTSNASECYKLSGLFYIHTSGPNWDGAYASTDNEKIYSRKVSVSNNTATLYLPCPAGANNWVPSLLTVTGHTSSGDIALYTDKSMKALGTVVRAHVKPLTPLIVNNLSRVNWSDAGVATSTLNPSSDKKGLSEMKVVADNYFLYARLTAPVEGFVGNYLDIYLSDGAPGGTHYAIADDNQYWTTAGETVYREEHRGSVTSSSITMSFNGKTVDSTTENDGDNVYWYLAFPRSAHSLISSTGTVYVAFMLWKDWGCNGAIPTRYTSMMPVTLP